MTNDLHFLLDCDPGIDDAFAILCALKYAHVDVITTVSGNVSLDNTTRNALHVLELAGVDVPVHRGANQPLSVPASFADDIHGASGFGNYTTPEPIRSVQESGAVEAILDYCADGDAVIVATGPLTNIALALEADPTISDRIAHLYWMGGATTKGNVTAHAEFNAWCDPHAVAATLASGIALTMFDLDLTHQVLMGPPEIERLRAENTDLGDFFADALEFYQRTNVEGTVGHAMHDPCALLGFCRPDHFTFRSSNIVCEIMTGEQRGMTVVGLAGNTLPHRVAETAEAKEVIELIITAITNPGSTQ